ncbi:uncharacterized protein YbjT (DUF2867 family) [Kineococcus xinjiangensis]|uniref:Uncharacterized protein YbjT (DUF2867 family) n=1 Tax=Kineococcus xinjiangensis TaxID=512762 RepID=A0A2S6IE12_9ACTN|nr:SDR family oxidoreductase [Kineococcus xinjiangensis]PPK92423.1 uncharacterized protein YbjT (DUF2867 family) [Kineococcus xinjiangensis]
MRIVVLGGTGVVGRHVVAALRASGHEAVVASRSTGVDLLTGAGLDAALEGAGAVVDASTVATSRARTAVEFFTRSAEHVLAAEVRAGVRHHVVVSIVGLERVPLGYYAGKLAQERAVLAGPVPVSILRATQFHEFAGQMLDRMAFGPVAAVPVARVQPVAARDVGAALADLALGNPVGRAPEMAGPEVFHLPDLARRTAAARGARVRVLPLRLPGAAGRAMAAGALCPDGAFTCGSTPFAQWLAGSGPAVGAGR